MSSLQIPVDIRRLPWVRRLAVDYAYNFQALAPFFAGNPASDSAWHDAIRRTLACERPRAALAELLIAQQERREAPAPARAAAARLRDPRVVAVVTGQQAGLFGGPLYTLLKALTAIRLAARVTRELSTPAVAVFWIDAEDHDWEEVRHCRVLDASRQVRTVSLPSPPLAGGIPVASLQLDSAVEGALEALSAALPRTEFSSDVIERLRGSYRTGTGMTEAFGRWMEGLLGPLGLVLFDCSDPAAKPHAAPVFVREFETPGRTAALAAQAGTELAARGYHAQVTPHPDSVALFHIGEGRRPIRQAAGRFAVGETIQSGAALATEAGANPARFSPNVLLRPVVQDTLFPTVCYVAGPSELAYQAQLRGVYEHFGVPMPLIHPRATATLLDSAALRFLARYDLPLESLEPQDEAALNRLLESQLPPGVERALEDVSAAVRERMDRLIAVVPAIDPTLEGAARSTLGRLEHDLQNLHGKIIQASKRRNDTLRRQFIHAQVQAFPEGRPQERGLGVAYFVNQFGPALVDRLCAELPLQLGTHWVLTV